MTITIPKMKDVTFFTTVLELINIVTKATSKEKVLHDTELRCLAYFLSLPYDTFKYRMFSTIAKTKVQKKAEEDNWELSKVNLNGKLTSITAKGLIVEDEDNIRQLSPFMTKLMDDIYYKKELDINFKLEWDQEGIG